MTEGKQIKLREYMPIVIRKGHGEVFMRILHRLLFRFTSGSLQLFFCIYGRQK